MKRRYQDIKNNTPDIARIRFLCDRYFEGEISDKEEEVLRNYFAEAGNVPDDMKSVSEMFKGFKEISGMRFHQAYTAATPGRKSGWRLRSRHIIMTAASAAAVAAVVLIFSNREIYGYDSNGNPITDCETALAQAEQLSILSDFGKSMDIAMELAGFADSITGSGKESEDKKND